MGKLRPQKGDCVLKVTEPRRPGPCFLTGCQYAHHKAPPDSASAPPLFTTHARGRKTTAPAGIGQNPRWYPDHPIQRALGIVIIPLSLPHPPSCRGSRALVGGPEPGERKRRISDKPRDQDGFFLENPEVGLLCSTPIVLERQSPMASFAFPGGLTSHILKYNQDHSRDWKEL